MKKVWKGAAAVVAALSLGVTGFVGATSAYAAPNDSTITVKQDDASKFTAYQIFTGDVNAEGKLTNVKWGADSTGKVGDPVDKATLDTIASWEKDGDAKKTEAQIAAALNGYLKAGATGTVLKADANTVDSGYYLIKQTTFDSNKESIKSLDMAKIVGTNGLTLDPKDGTVTSQKKVQENNKTVTGNTDPNRVTDYTLEEKYNDVADYNIGDTVPFEFVGTIPANYDKFDTFKYIFHDTMSDGLTFNKGSVKVYKNNTNTDITSDFTVADGANGETFTVAPNNMDQDLKKISTKFATGDKIIIRYNATLNSDAEIGLPGNPNEMYLEFSNNPNDTTGTDTTPVDKVVVFTYNLDVTKVDKGDNKKKLKGAKFKLQATDGTHANKWYKATTADDKTTVEWVDAEADATELESDAKGAFSISGLDAGQYNLKETVAPDGYTLLSAPIAIEIKAVTVNNQEFDGTASNALTKLTVVVAGKGSNELDLNDGAVPVTVENGAESSLPSTGGMGTTILYTVGAIIVLAAAAGLTIALRRRNA